jgi:hypothetical protein
MTWGDLGVGALHAFSESLKHNKKFHKFHLENKNIIKFSIVSVKKGGYSQEMGYDG